MDLEMARKLADEIHARRTSLADEDKLAHVDALRARAKKWRDQDAARVNGMVIGLTYMLGRPFDMQLAKEFIEDTPTWRAML